MANLTIEEVVLSSKGLLADAALVVEEIATQYDERLTDDLSELRAKLRNKKYKEGAKAAYHIECIASTMGWPLVSEAARNLRHVLEDLRGRSLPVELERLHLGALYLFLDRNMKGRDERGLPVLKVLKNVKSRLKH